MAVMRVCSWCLKLNRRIERWFLQLAISTVQSVRINLLLCCCITLTVIIIAATTSTIAVWTDHTPVCINSMLQVEFAFDVWQSASRYNGGICSSCPLVDSLVKYLRLDPLESAASEDTGKEEQSVSTDLLLYKGGYLWYLLQRRLLIAATFGFEDRWILIFSAFLEIPRCSIS